MPQEIKVTALVNRILWPRLRELGFRFEYAVSENWAEGSIIVRDGPHGRRQGLLMGRDKFGHSFGVTAARELADGSWDYLNLLGAGLTPEEHSYQTPSEAEAVLTRIAKVVATHMIPWLDEDGPRVAASVARPNEEL